MPVKQRKIPINPSKKIFYLIDANFLVNKHLNQRNINSGDEKDRIIAAKGYWKIIDRQLENNMAQVYILDVCIAETFKVLAKKYYNSEPIFKNHSSYSHVCSKIRRNISLSPKEAKKYNRNIKYHDIQTNRDIIIGVDRFFENINRKKIKSIGIVDIMILSTARYLMDYFGINKNCIAIITQDNNLYKLACSYQNLPAAFNPHKKNDSYKKVFYNT